MQFPGSTIEKPGAQQVTVLGIPISSRNLLIPSDLDRIHQSAHPTIITFVNPHACWIAGEQPDYVADLRAFDWVLCDGIGMVVAARRLRGLKVQREAFDLASIAGPVLQWLETVGLRVLLIGGKEGVADSAAQRLMPLFPTLRISGTFSGFASGPEEATAYLLANPGTAVICGMGAPVQERFLLELKRSGWRGIGFTCGGFFDQLNTRTDYYPRWIDAMNLRFVYRLYREPRRLARRYLVEYQVFMKLFLKEYICGNRHP